MRSFEAAFCVPSHHFLEQVRTRAQGGEVPVMYWEHREYDARGQLVARYESFQECCNERYARSCGWRKYDGEGRLMAAGQLPVQVSSIPFDET
jgi:hypothetical protein